MDVMHCTDLRIGAMNNDRDHYRLALEDEVDNIILERGDRNSELIEAYSSRPEVHTAFIGYLMRTHDDSRVETK